MLEEIEEYLKQEEQNKELSRKGEAFLEAISTVERDIALIEDCLASANRKLKPFDIVDYFSSVRVETRDLGLVNKILKDLSEVEEGLCGNKEYFSRYQKVLKKIINTGEEIVESIVDEERYENNKDLVEYVSYLEDTDKIMQMVIEKRRIVCSRKIKHFSGDFDIFFQLLVNQELFIWSKIFPKDFMTLIRRLISLDIPLGYSQFERFIYAIFRVYFGKQKSSKSISDLEDALVRNSEILSFVDEYPKLSSPTHEFVYNSLLLKALKEYSNDGVVDL